MTKNRNRGWMAEKQRKSLERIGFSFGDAVIAALMQVLVALAVFCQIAAVSCL